MRAMMLDVPRRPLRAVDISRPEPGPGQVLLAVAACGVCRTDLHVLDGELPNPTLPLILGHEIVGTVTATGGGPGVDRFGIGDRVGVPWLGWSCGSSGTRRSSSRARAPRGGALARLELRRVPLLPLGTGEPVRSGALHGLPDQRRVRRIRGGGRPVLLSLPDQYADLEAAPLLCAG